MFLSDEFVCQIHQVPLLWRYKEARKIFLDAPQVAPTELSWAEPDEDSLVEFLCRTARVRCVLTPVLASDVFFRLLRSVFMVYL